MCLVGLCFPSRVCACAMNVLFTCFFFCYFCLFVFFFLGGGSISAVHLGTFLSWVIP